MTAKKRLLTALAVLLAAGAMVAGTIQILIPSLLWLRGQQAGSIAIIGGADGPTAIYLAEGPSPAAALTLAGIGLAALAGGLALCLHRSGGDRR